MSIRPLEDTVEELLAVAYSTSARRQPSTEWMTAIAMRAGTRGPVATLNEAGVAAGVTRERVRQVMNRLSTHLLGQTVPCLHEVAQMLVDLSPVPEPIGEHLAHTGRTRLTLTGPGFLSILDLLGTSPQELVGTDLICVDDWLVEESEAVVMKSVSTAAQHTSSFGMTTVEEIRQELAAPGVSLDPLDIRRVLETQASVKWAGDWLWVEKADSLHASRLINTARSILSVNSPQTVASIHEGCRRVWKFRKLDVLPPVAAMKTFFAASPYFTMSGDLVHPNESLDYHDLVGGVTASMIDVLKSQPEQIMDRRTLQEACDEAGIKKGTYGVWTTYAEWMDNYGTNVWGLRGANPNPAVIEAVRDAARRRSAAEPRRKAWSWTPDGRVVQTMDVSSSFVSSGVMSFVPGIHRLLEGQAVEVFANGTPLATVKLGDDHSFCWGWAPILTTLRAAPGHVLRVSVDTATRVAEVEIGGEELWRAATVDGAFGA